MTSNKNHHFNSINTQQSPKCKQICNTNGLQGSGHAPATSKCSQRCADLVNSDSCRVSPRLRGSATHIHFTLYLMYKNTKTQMYVLYNVMQHINYLDN